MKNNPKNVIMRHEVDQFSFWKPSKTTYKSVPVKCMICGTVLTLDNVFFPPTFELRMMCRNKDCLVEFLRRKEYYVEVK